MPAVEDLVVGDAWCEGGDDLVDARNGEQRVVAAGHEEGSLLVEGACDGGRVSECHDAGRIPGRVVENTGGLEGCHRADAAVQHAGDDALIAGHREEADLAAERVSNHAARSGAGVLEDPVDGHGDVGDVCAQQGGAAGDEVPGVQPFVVGAVA